MTAEGRPTRIARGSCGPRAFDVFPYEQAVKSGRPDSNRRRPAWEAGILPTELRPRTVLQYCRGTTVPQEPAVGIEPTTARLRIGCSTTELRWRPQHPTARLGSGVPWRGLEPRRLTAPPPQDGVSTNFTTRAFAARTERPRDVHFSNGADGARTRDLRCDRPAL